MKKVANSAFKANQPVDPVAYGRLETLIANHPSPLRLMREAADLAYRRSLFEGEEACRALVLALLVDLPRRRQEAGLRPIPKLTGGIRG